MKNKILILSFLILVSCSIDSGVVWKERIAFAQKDEAKTLLAEFRLVEQEINNYDSIIRIVKEGDLYFDDRDTSLLEEQFKIILPNLKKWFSKHKVEFGRNYISYRGEEITVNFYSSKSRTILYYAFLYHSNLGIESITKDWKKQVELKDSLSLGNNWYYILTKCDGCDD